MRLFKISIFLIFISPLVCNAQQNNSQTGSSADTLATEVQTIHIYGIDNMKFVVKKEGESIKTGSDIKATNGKTYMQVEQIEVTAGKKVRLTLTSIGNLPASAMSHNWVLLNNSVDPAAFATAAMQAKENQYIPKSQKNNVLASTSLAAGGETVEVTFMAPEDKGKYNYLCTFPGHFQAGMKGTLVVK